MITLETGTELRIETDLHRHTVILSLESHDLAASLELEAGQAEDLAASLNAAAAEVYEAMGRIGPGS